MEDNKILGLFGAGTALSGINSFISGLMPVLSVLLVLAQIAIAIITAVLLWKKLKKKSQSDE